MAGTARRAAKRDGPKTEVRAIREELNHVITDLETLRRGLRATQRDKVFLVSTAGTGAGFSVDANAEDVETDNAVLVRWKGRIFPMPAVTALDISASGTCAGDTITASKYGAIWAFAKLGGTLDVETGAAAQAFNSAVLALGYWGTTPLVAMEDLGVPLGVLGIANAGVTFTIGTTATTGLSTFADFVERPCVETVCASMAIGATPTAVTYGAGVGRLGSAVRVSYTGKANCTLAPYAAETSIADKRTGAWTLEILADDVEVAVQQGAAFADLAAARAAVAGRSLNPYLIHIGSIYVTNNSGADFVPGTTSLATPGLTVTFDIASAPTDIYDAAADLIAATVNA